MNVKVIEKSEKEFEEHLNEVYGTVEICGMEFEQGTALKELDPTAFDVAHADEPTQYQCGECDEVYDEEDEAEACCKEDSDTEGK